MYFESLYLAAEKGQLPELKRVIVAYGNSIAMEDNLETSLQRIFGAKVMKEEKYPSQAQEELFLREKRRTGKRPSMRSVITGGRRNT